MPPALHLCEGAAESCPSLTRVEEEDDRPTESCEP